MIYYKSLPIPESVIDRALNFCREGWSTRVAISKAGINTRLCELLINSGHPKVSEMQKLSAERLLSRRMFKNMG